MTTTVRIAMVAPAALLVPMWAAETAGEMAAHGLVIDARFTGSTEVTTQLMLDGEVDVASGAADPALAAPDKVQILAGLADRPPLSLIAQPHITTIEELRGKSLGTTSLREGTVQLVAAIMAQHDLRYPEDYTFVRAGAHPQRWKALQDGTIDAALQLMPFDFMAERAGFSVLARAEDYVPFFAFGSFCARSDWVDAHPEVAAALQDALRKGAELVRNDRSWSAALIADRAHVGLDDAARCVDRLIDTDIMPSGLVHSTHALDRLRQAMTDSAALTGELA